MFTGIVQARGRLQRLTKHGVDATVVVALGELADQTIALGDSVATNGVCLTVTRLDSGCFEAEVSAETLKHTALGGLSVGAPLNLELAMQPTSRFGGHIVSGHVDGVGVILEARPDGRSTRWQIQMPQEIAHYVAHKGSITIDGVSLTVNTVGNDFFEVNIVPHTANNTLFDTYKVGHRVNLEVDVVARYLERLLSARQSPQSLSYDTLLNAGFVK
ncbi:MAG: riboflavin synthase [Gammaproteobacteria bacterium]|nr:riboflavin synthase [Gammaproteobacteria bacterium]